MDKFLERVETISKYANVVGGISLMIIVFLTVSDVTLRWFGHPIAGTYEMVSFLGSMVFAFALPYTSWKKQHIFVDFAINWLPVKVKNGIMFLTRCLVAFIFIGAGWNLMKYSADLWKSNELTSTLHIPFAPIPFLIAIACIVECLVMGCELIKLSRGTYE